MYSFTLTNVHSLYPIQPTEPKLVVKCKCNRRIYQQQCYTCLICPSYCCHYCTQIQFVDFQCRSCKKQYDATNKTNRCQFCFSCIQCSNVLKLSKDPQTKNYIFMCQFCFWSTKDIKLVEQKLQVLLDKLNKYSTSIKDSELKIYNYAYTFFKQTNLAIQLQNQAAKFFSNTKKPIKKFIEDSSITNKQQIQKMQKNSDSIIKRTGLDQPSQEYHVQFKYPQGLPLIAKKIRKCPDCKKPLTTIFRARTEDPKNAKLTGTDPKARHGDQKIQLMHKDIKILVCQYTPLTSNKAKIKLLKDAVIEGQEHKKDEIVQVQANREFEVSIKIENRMRNTVSQATYVFIVDGPIIKPGTK